MDLIEEMVRRHAEETPSHQALICRSLSLTYGQLWRCAALAARWLNERNVVTGHRVAIPAGDDPWFTACYLGTHLAGAVAIPLDPRLPQRAADEVLAAASPDFILAGDDLEVLKQVLHREAEEGCATGRGQGITLPARDDIADILFTSGSTGKPKGVVLTHANIATAAHNINAFIGNDAADREVVTLPLSHSFGLGRLRCNLVARGTLIVVPGLTFPALVYKALEEHDASGLSCVPAGMAVLLKPGGQYLAAAGRHLRYIELGSAPMAVPAKRALMELLPDTRICMHYGLTEASRSAFIEFHADATRLDSVGRASANVEIHICGDDGSLLEAGHTGRIRVRGGTVMREYWRDPERTRQVLGPDGWLDTGDVGRLDSEGYLFLSGRRDDLINVGGRKVYPPLVEEAVAQHADVLESACIGAPDPDGVLGEVPVLYVVPRELPPPGVEALREFMGRHLEPHAVPRLVRFVNAIPRTASGKPLRAALRAREASRTA